MEKGVTLLTVMTDSQYDVTFIYFPRILTLKARKRWAEVPTNIVYVQIWRCIPRYRIYGSPRSDSGNVRDKLSFHVSPLRASSAMKTKYCRVIGIRMCFLTRLPEKLAETREREKYENLISFHSSRCTPSPPTATSCARAPWAPKAAVAPSPRRWRPAAAATREARS